MSDHLPESSSLTSILAELGCTTRKDYESGWLAKDNPETSPITINPRLPATDRAALLAPLPSRSPPGCPFPIKSLALSAHVSPRTIHFWVLDTSPVSGPGGGPPSCNITRKHIPTQDVFIFRPRPFSFPTTIGSQRRELYGEWLNTFRISLKASILTMKLSATGTFF